MSQSITNLPNYPITKCREAGFTLIEAMVVITLLVVLASTGLVQYRHAVVRASEATLKDDLHKMRQALNEYYSDKNRYPASLEDLVTEGYIRKIPEDPFTRSASTWQTVDAPPDPNNYTAQTGVYDIKSGSDGVALDGSRYADW